MKTVYLQILRFMIDGYLVKTSISWIKFTWRWQNDRVDGLSEKQLNLLNNALYRLKASKSVFDITLEEIVGQYEIVTEYMSPRSVEIAVENYKEGRK